MSSAIDWPSHLTATLAPQCIGPRRPSPPVHTQTTDPRVGGSCTALLDNLKIKVDGVWRQKHGEGATIYHTGERSGATSTTDVADPEELAWAVGAGDKPSRGKHPSRRDSGELPPNSPSANGSVVGKLTMPALAEHEEELATREGAGDKPSKGKRRDSGELPPNSPSMGRVGLGQLAMPALAEHADEAGAEELASGVGELSIDR